MPGKGSSGAIGTEWHSSPLALGRWNLFATGTMSAPGYQTRAPNKKRALSQRQLDLLAGSCTWPQKNRRRRSELPQILWLIRSLWCWGRGFLPRMHCPTSGSLNMSRTAVKRSDALLETSVKPKNTRSSILHRNRWYIYTFFKKQLGLPDWRF